jgi:hypothetical protein
MGSHGDSVASFACRSGRSFMTFVAVVVQQASPERLTFFTKLEGLL